MSHNYRPPADRNQWVGGQCPTSGKRSYFNRKAAKAVARDHRNTGDARMRPYACVDCGYWHIGHLAEWRVRGQMSVPA